MSYELYQQGLMYHCQKCTKFIPIEHEGFNCNGYEMCAPCGMTMIDRFPDMKYAQFNKATERQKKLDLKKYYEDTGDRGCDCC